jgi:hypothetical protein
MENKKQTAVEFLGHELNVKLFYDISPELWEQVNEIFKQALEMEKEQIQDAFYCGIEVDESTVHSPYRAAEDYFKQNY